MHVDSAIIYKADIDDLCAYDVDDMGEWNTELTVTRFLDLMHDKIVPWRLEEIGLTYVATAKDGGSIVCGISMSTFVAIKVVLPFDGSPAQVGITCLSINKESQTNVVNIPLDGISTFTDLLTLIKFSQTQPRHDNT